MKTFLVNIFIFIVAFVNAQTPSILGPDSGMHRPMVYAPIREADVAWAKRIWRVIDLNEKINSPLRYPLSNSSTERKSLIDILLESIRGGEVTAYSSNDDGFSFPMDSAEISRIGGARIDAIDIVDPNPPHNSVPTPIKKPFEPDKVIAYRLKEDWIFDKQRSVIEVRIIGIAPMMYAEDEKGARREGNLLVPVFWVYYPEIRNILANNYALFNQANDGNPSSFDDIFQKRMFSSCITKESNVYDRTIASYTSGLSTVLESERIKTDIEDMEHDMWEY